MNTNTHDAGAGHHSTGASDERMTRDADGREHFDTEYRQWRDDQAHAMDRDYAEWRRHRFARDFSDWRSIRAAQAGLRTGSGGPITHEDRERLLRGDAAVDRREAEHGSAKTRAD
jgi:hypothetical protein